MTLKQVGFGFVQSGLLSLAGVVAFSAPSQALNNGGFESGLTGWSATGDVSTVGNFGGFSFTPPEGRFQAVLNTGSANPLDPLSSISGTSAVDIDSLEAFLGLPPLALGATALEGSGLQQTFTTTLPGTLSFDWNFLGETAQPDFAFVVVNGNLVLPPLATAPGTTGFNSFSTFLNEADTYTLGFGIVNVNDVDGASQLLVDNLNFAPVPAPPQFLGVALAVALGAFGRYRRQRATTTKDKS